jgi:hypothetical protein
MQDLMNIVDLSPFEPPTTDFDLLKKLADGAVMKALGVPPKVINGTPSNATISIDGNLYPVVTTYSITRSGQKLPIHVDFSLPDLTGGYYSWADFDWSDNTSGVYFVETSPGKIVFSDILVTIADKFKKEDAGFFRNQSKIIDSISRSLIVIAQSIIGDGVEMNDNDDKLYNLLSMAALVPPSLSNALSMTAITPSLSKTISEYSERMESGFRERERLIAMEVKVQSIEGLPDLTGTDFSYNSDTRSGVVFINTKMERGLFLTALASIADKFKKEDAVFFLDQAKRLNAIAETLKVMSEVIRIGGK